MQLILSGQAADSREFTLLEQGRWVGIVNFNMMKSLSPQHFMHIM